MAVRSSMAALIARVRQLIGDPASATQQFDDQAIQDALDVTRVEVRYAPLEVAPSLSAGGIVNYNTFLAGVEDWETDATLYSPSYALLAPATSDYLVGRWTFSGAPPGQVIPVLILGKYYDRYGASAELLEQWAALLARAYDFTAAGQTFKRSQQAQVLLAQAARYRARSRPSVLEMVRNDA